MNPIYLWHDMLNMPKYDEAWHRQDMADEIAEYWEAKGFIDVWSELSDVAYTYTRAKWSGHGSITFPFSNTRYFAGLLYMFPKYTLRFWFFRKLGKKLDKDLKISEVRNPKKVSKLAVIAEKYNLDPEPFTSEAKKMLRYWVLFK
jgi:hypothetical protein